jgi:hypothetical protein
MKEAARKNALHDSNWDAVLREITGERIWQEEQDCDGEGLDYLPSSFFMRAFESSGATDLNFTIWLLKRAAFI